MVHAGMGVRSSGYALWKKRIHARLTFLRLAPDSVARFAHHALKALIPLMALDPHYTGLDGDRGSLRFAIWKRRTVFAKCPSSGGAALPADPLG